MSIRVLVHVEDVAHDTLPEVKIASSVKVLLSAVAAQLRNRLRLGEALIRDDAHAFVKYFGHVGHVSWLDGLRFLVLPQDTRDSLVRVAHGGANADHIGLNWLVALDIEQ